VISWSIVDMIFSTIWLVFRSKWPTRIKLKNKKYMLYLHSKFSGSLLIWLKSQNSNTENYNNKIQKKKLFRNSCLTWASYVLSNKDEIIFCKYYEIILTTTVTAIDFYLQCNLMQKITIFSYRNFQIIAI
jgi:hypothetical protein